MTRAKENKGTLAQVWDAMFVKNHRENLKPT